MRISVEGLTKSFNGGKDVLRGVSYEDEVRTLAVIGPSGSGKSTLLRIVGGLLPASCGALAIDGEALPQKEAELIEYRKKNGFVFQIGGLFKHLTGFENIVVPLMKVHGYSRSDAARRAGELLARFGLAEDAEKKPGELSGGQQQRISIARAIAPKPRILLLDEPTSALDPEYTAQVLDMINELKGEGMDFIIVTHEMGFALHACEKAMFICEGRLLESGRSSTLFANPETPELRQFLSKLLHWHA